MKPLELYDWWGVEPWKWDVVVMESFRLYTRMAAAQAWSTFGTVEVIGVVKERCRQERVELTMQSASVKKPIAAILRARGVALTGKGPHARDAELHGWHWVLANGGWKA